MKIAYNETKEFESEVRLYSRLFPTMFRKAKDSFLFDMDNNRFLDFFCGAGSLNYGHNNQKMKEAMLDYINDDGITNSLDQMTEAKYLFMSKFNDIILSPRELQYKIQFNGPTGTNCVEAALKLARKYTKREEIVYFEDSYHGLSYGSLSVSGLRNKTLSDDYKKNVKQFPFSDDKNSISKIEYYLSHCSPDKLPAAIILETIQAEGGIKVAPKEWLSNLASLAKQYNVLLIADEIQIGCGRTGDFFSFETAGIQPDIICLSKSLSGYGLPFSINLIKPEIDCWSPGEHTGTFRGNNLAFITAAVALDYWIDNKMAEEVATKSKLVDSFFQNNKTYNTLGRGLIRGIEFKNGEIAQSIQKSIFNNGILVDICGDNDNFIKLMPPLTITKTDLKNGLEIINNSINDIL